THCCVFRKGLGVNRGRAVWIRGSQSQIASASRPYERRQEAKEFGGIAYRAAISSDTNGTCTGRHIRSGLVSARRLFQKNALPARLLFGAGSGYFASKQRPLSNT